MQFDQVIAQREVKHQLKELVQKNRLSHALLFLGKEGSGALPLAIAFAQYILCEKVNPKSKKDITVSLFGDKEIETIPKNWEDSCGVCASCNKAEQ
ncbi:MAG TPA: hypothetical protein VJ279_04225, partial [Hanamia sp.]|nr:hypothetical protein [Hanamia sp.]